MTKTTGWPTGLLQDDSTGLSRWFASQLDARLRVREVCAEIRKERKMKDGPLCKPKGSPLREPLRTIDELAEEFKIPKWSLVAYMRNPTAPKPVFTNSRKAAKSQTWYKPSEVRNWWRAFIAVRSSDMRVVK